MNKLSLDFEMSLPPPQVVLSPPKAATSTHHLSQTPPGLFEVIREKLALLDHKVPTLGLDE